MKVLIQNDQENVTFEIEFKINQLNEKIEELNVENINLSVNIFFVF